MGIKHLVLVKKPGAFQLGVLSPMIEGAEDAWPARRGQRLEDAKRCSCGAQLAFANSDFAFQATLFQGIFMA